MVGFKKMAPKLDTKRGGLVWLLVLAFIGAMFYAAGDQIYDVVVRPQVASSLGATVETPETQAIEQLSAGVTEEEVRSCDGIASLNLLFDDKDAFRASTDPSLNVTIYDPIQKVVADDATSTTVPVKSDFKALVYNSIGTPGTSYFSMFDEFSTGCTDKEYQPKLYPASAPTMTITNDNGVTLNSDTNHESADALNTYSPCVTVKAPAERSSSEFGAIVAFEYDATYVNKVASSDLADDNRGILIAHTTNHSASEKDFDQYKVMRYDGTLRDGDKVEFCFDVTMTSTAVGEDQGNVMIHWLPLNNDLDADTLVPIMNQIYDEDNHEIYIANNTAIYYTA